MNLKTIWKSDLAFDAKIGPHTLRMDAREEAGGKYSGPTPKEVVLAGVCGCTGIDVVLILKKMRQPLESLEIDSEATQTDEDPAVFDRVTLVYRAKGTGLLPEKLKHAVELSQTKYCGVSAMIAKSAKILYRIELNGTEIGTGEARFA